MGSSPNKYWFLAGLKQGPTRDYVVGLFEDGFYPGEIIKVEKEYIMADFLKPVSLKQNYQDTSLWKKPTQCNSDVHRLEISSILPISPVLRLSGFSSSRIVICELINVDLIQNVV